MIQAALGLQFPTGAFTTQGTMVAISMAKHDPI
jgi:hypothetical protein